MYFIDINDPKKCDAIVADYLATVKRIQQRNVNEKAQDLTRQDDLQKMFNPVVESTEKSTKAITEELAPMREEIKNLNENVLHQMTAERPQKKTKTKRKGIDEESKLNVAEQYLATYDDSKLDIYFSIQRTGVNEYMMGDKNVLVDKKSNISIGGVKYEYTLGLWKLIMMKTVGSYTNGDLLNYGRLVQQTNVMTYPRNKIQGQSRPKTKYKWRNILASLQQQKA